MLLADARYLDPDVVPERELVMHRRTELEHLLDCLHPDTGTGSTDWTFLVGPTGVGKTMLARLALDELASDVDTRSVYISCWDRYDRHPILLSLVSNLVGAAVHDQTATHDLVDYLHTDPDCHRLVILDEIDQLTDTDVLYDLAESPSLSVIGIANALDELWTAVDDRTNSRIRVGHTLELDAYTVDELTAILEKRTEYALGYGRQSTPTTPAATNQQLEQIARAADGDARVGIAILRAAIDHAADDSRRTITESDIDAAITDGRTEVRQQNLSSLNRHQRILYDILLDAGPLGPTPLYDRYCDEVSDARAKRTMRTYLTKLQHYNLVECSGSTHNRQYDANPLPE